MTPRRLASVAGWMVLPYTERGGAFLGEGRWESELSLDPSLEDCSSVLEISSQSVSYLCAVLVLCFLASDFGGTLSGPSSHLSLELTSCQPRGPGARNLVF